MAASWRGDYQIYRQYLKSIVNLYKERQDFRMYTELLLSLVSIVVFGVFAIRPTLVTVAGLNTEIQGKKETAKTMDEKIRNLAAAQILFEQEKEKINLLDTAIPNEPVPEEHIRQVEGLAKENNVSIIGFTVGGVIFQGENTEEVVALEGELSQASELNDSFPVNIRVNGDYPSLAGFLSDIELMRRPIIFEAVRMAIEDGDLLQELTLTIGGQIPFFK